MKIIKRFKSKIMSLIRSNQERIAFDKNIKIVRALANASGSADFTIIDCGFNQGKVASRILKALPRFSLVGFEVQQDIKEYSLIVKKNSQADRSMLFTVLQQLSMAK